MPEPLLDLSTLAPTRPTIRIDGTEYQMHVMDDFGAVELYHLNVLGEEAVKIQRVRQKGRTEQQAIDFSENLSKQVNMMIIDLPDEVLAKLTDPMKGQILKVFSDTAGQNTEKEVDKEAEARPTGEKSSPDSSDSTGETPEDGSI